MRQNTANQDLRDAIARQGLFQWQVARRLGISDTFFSKMMRVELPDGEKKRILDVIGATDGTEEEELDGETV